MDEVYKLFVAMRAKYTDKSELASNTLKDVAQTWCKMWQER